MNNSKIQFNYSAKAILDLVYLFHLQLNNTFKPYYNIANCLKDLVSILCLLFLYCTNYLILLYNYMFALDLIRMLCYH